ncbi:MAG: nucleotidyltransferase family protein [Cyanobacteria bacterium]|nr:nucleotidyltransferase family protein [Cyanobacteriota bacterium]
MKSLFEIRESLKKQFPVVQKDYQVKNLGIFGSYIRNEQTEESDLDILVEFMPDARFGLLKFCALENHLSEILEIKVDLVIKEGLKPHIGECILAEVDYLSDFNTESIRKS